MGGKGYESNRKSNVTEKQAQRIGLISDSNVSAESVRGAYFRITYRKIINGVIYIFTRYEKKKKKRKKRP